MVKKPARSTITLRAIEHLQNKLSELKALKDTVQDKRALVSEAVRIFDSPIEGGDHTDAIHYGLMRLVEMKIEEEWAKYLKHFREEQDRGNGQIAAAWPDEDA
jgi:hypothetical protein